MIAANYLKHPEALRFQRELFHNGFKNSPRIMRAMECIFKFAPDVPQWAKDMARKARQLVKLWKGGQIQINMAALIDTAANQTIPEEGTKVATFPPENYYSSSRWNPCFTVEKADWSWAEEGAEWLEYRQGVYVSFCRRHQGGFQSCAGTRQKVFGYSETRLKSR